MELETALMNQLKEEIGDGELSNSEQKLLRQKFGMLPVNLSEEPSDYTLPEFLQVKQFSLAMQGKGFKSSTWRDKWLKNKRELRKLLRRNRSQHHARS